MMFNPDARVAIILLNWNGWQDTLECVQSLLSMNNPSFHIYIVDAASNDDSVCHIKAWLSGQASYDFLSDNSLQRHLDLVFPIPYQEIDAANSMAAVTASFQARLTLLRLNQNLGYAGGNNAGLRAARHDGPFDYYWVLNNDTVVLADTLTYLVDKMESDTSIGICGATLFYYDRPKSVQTLGGNRYNRWLASSSYIVPPGEQFDPSKINPDSVERQMDMVHGASMFVRNSFLDTIGYMNEAYFLFSEEIDWAIRGRDAFRLGYAPQSVVYHKRGQSTGNTISPISRSTTTDYYSFRSRLLFTKKYFPWALPTVLFGMAASIIRRLLRGQKEHAGAILKAIWDALFTPSNA